MQNIPKRKPGLDALRFFACIGIVLLHYSNYSCPDGVWFGSLLIDPAAADSRINLNLMVEIFFFLSGFLIFPYTEKIRQGLTFRDFIVPRLIRIIPMLTAGTVLLVIVSRLLSFSGNDHNVADITPHLWGIISSCLGISYCNIFASADINQASWYLDILITCYVLFYMIVKISKKTNTNILYYYPVLILLGGTCYAHSFSLPFMSNLSGRGYEAFFSGALFSYFFESGMQKKRYYLFSVSVIAIYTIYLFLHPELLLSGKVHLYNFFVTPSLLILFTSPLAEKIFASKIWSILGKVTYSVYILHIVILLGLVLTENILGLKIDYAHEVVFFFFILITLLISSIVYYVFEKPLSGYLLKKLSTNRSS